MPFSRDEDEPRGLLIPWQEVARLLRWPLCANHAELADKLCEFTPCAEGLLVEPIKETGGG